MTREKEELTEDARRPIEAQLSAYLDNELEPQARADVESMLASDAMLRAQLGELALMRDAVVASFDAVAANVPQARFEQIWDEIDRQLDRETAARLAVADAPSLWQRLVALVRPVWVPVAATGGVAAVLVVAITAAPDPNAANLGDVQAAPVATVSPPNPAIIPVPAPPQPLSEPKLIADPTVREFPAPALYEAEIERIEFSGRSGRIGTIEGKRGTTTVIWVSDDEPTPGERSL